MITDEDIKKLVTVFATKDDFLAIESHMSSLEYKFGDLQGAMKDLQAEVQNNTDSIIKEFLKVFDKAQITKERVDLHEKKIKHNERRFQKIKLCID